MLKHDFLHVKNTFNHVFRRNSWLIAPAGCPAWMSDRPLQVIYDMQDAFGGVSELLMRWAKEEMFEVPVINGPIRINWRFFIYQLVIYSYKYHKP